MNIILIIGLPGSGKTRLAHTLFSTYRPETTVLIDDLSVGFEDKVMTVLPNSEVVIITDPNACVVSREQIEERLVEMFGPHELYVMGFENDPTTCFENVMDRMDERLISLATIMSMSSRYHPEQVADSVLPVWKKPEDDAV